MVLRVRMILICLAMSLVGYSQMVVYEMPFPDPPIAGYIAWYDSKDVASITKSETNFVSQWNDKSGNGYNLISSGPNQPLYSSTDGIVFDGTNDYLVQNFGITYNTPLTIFIVNNIVSGSTDGHSLLSNYLSPNNLSIFEFSGYIKMWGIENVLAKIYPITKYILTAKYNVSNSSIQINNGTASTGYINATTLNSISIGGNYYWGYLNCKIEEILIYNSALSAAEITSVNNYLKNKYNVTY